MLKALAKPRRAGPKIAPNAGINSVDKKFQNVRRIGRRSSLITLKIAVKAGPRVTDNPEATF
jgi:hypothetical protein